VSTVWIPNSSTHDFTEAEEYGDIVFLTQGSVNRYATSKYYREFKELMADSKPADYLLITGLTILNILASNILVGMHGKVNLLIFKHDKKRKQKTYLERTIKV